MFMNSVSSSYFLPLQNNTVCSNKAQSWWNTGLRDFLNNDFPIYSAYDASVINGNTNYINMDNGRVSCEFNNEDEQWDISEVSDFERPRRKKSILSLHFPSQKIKNLQAWLLEDTSRGIIRVYDPDFSWSHSRLMPCSLSTTCQQICLKLGCPSNALHIQYNGDVIRRLEPYDYPLVHQNEYLASIGYSDICKIQEIGPNAELGFLVRFYAGKPIMDSTFSRHMLSGQIFVRKGKVFYQWSCRMCAISGTRLMVYPGLEKNGVPEIFQLAKGKVEEVKMKNRERCLKLTATLQGARTIYLSFNSDADLQKWLRKTTKATAQLPNSADLSNNHLEFLPENLFVNDCLSRLNLRHNALKERPIEEDIYTIGWVDDLHRFSNLRSLNLADNDLRIFPLTLCRIKTLIELNLASNKIEEIPPQISELSNLQILHLHNNHISSIPRDLAALKQLFLIVLAFNKFSSIPEVLTKMRQVEHLVLTGNYIEKLPADLCSSLRHIYKMDFRMNNLTLSPAETMCLELLDNLTHLDIRNNNIINLDLRSLNHLDYLNCGGNNLVSLQANGAALKKLITSKNNLQSLFISPVPNHLILIDVSHNQLTKLPDWLCDHRKLEKLDCSYNRLTQLPHRLFCGMASLKVMKLDHNQLTVLPEVVEDYLIEEMYIQHNKLTSLPDEFLIAGHKLRVLNATNNRLTTLPPLNTFQDKNKVQELYLTCNYLTDAAFEVLSGYSRLKILHIAYNDLQNISENTMQHLDMLEEINLSGNKLSQLPNSLGNLTKLQTLRIHSNLLKSLPKLSNTSALKVLDIGCNQLHNMSISSIMAGNLKYLDVSCNSTMLFNQEQLETYSSERTISFVDTTGRSRTALYSSESKNSSVQGESQDSPWIVGFSETSGIRNKLCISQIRQPNFGADCEALFGMFDGGHNNEVPLILQESVANILQNERKHEITAERYLTYTMLTAHSQLKLSGQRLGAATVLCHILKSTNPETDNKYTMHVANVGHCEAVLCRQGEPICLTQLCTIADNLEERERVRKANGIITEDNEINGNTIATRLLGCSYLYPCIIPNPYIKSVNLRHDDEFLIIANRGIWQYLSYSEAVQEIREISNPILASKRLLDLAQSYGSRENLSVLVIRFNFEDTVNKILIKKLRQQTSPHLNDELGIALIRTNNWVQEEQNGNIQDNDDFDQRIGEEQINFYFTQKHKEWDDPEADSANTDSAFAEDHLSFECRQGQLSDGSEVEEISAHTSTSNAELDHNEIPEPPPPSDIGMYDSLEEFSITMLNEKNLETFDDLPPPPSNWITSELSQLRSYPPIPAPKPPHSHQTSEGSNYQQDLEVHDHEVNMHLRRTPPNQSQPLLSVNKCSDSKYESNSKTLQPTKYEKPKVQVSPHLKIYEKQSDKSSPNTSSNHCDQSNKCSYVNANENRTPVKDLVRELESVFKKKSQQNGNFINIPKSEYQKQDISATNNNPEGHVIELRSYGRTYF